MIHVQNLSYIQHAALEDSVKGLLKYHVVGRITLLGTSLRTLAEAVVRAVAWHLSKWAASCARGQRKDEATGFSKNQLTLAKEAIRYSLDCFLSIYSPKSLETRLVNNRPIKNIVRENRIRLGADLIQRKLVNQFEHAQRKMGAEPNSHVFKYVQGDLGTVERKTVDGLAVGLCGFVGRRREMEDEALATSFHLHIAGHDYPVQLFGVFDGHAGPEASLYLKNNLERKLQEVLTKYNPNGLSDEGIWNALKQTFVQLDSGFRGESGSTAAVALILDGKLWTANVGDSRAILDNGGEIIQLSEDAKPADDRYKRGIIHRGGYILAGRLNGDLGVARAIGDHVHEGAVSARPKITVYPMSQVRLESHLVICCDGIYDVASSVQVGTAIHGNSNEEIGKLSQNLVNSAYQAGSLDNLSAVVVRLR